MPPDSRPPAPARQRSLRERNLATVLRHVAAGPVSRAAISASTGLTRATVSAIAEELLVGGLVAELTPEPRAAAGRPAAGLTLARTGPAGLGCEINVDYQAVCVVDLHGVVRHRETSYVDERSRTPEQAFASLAELASAAVAAAAYERLEVVGATLAIPGLIEGRTIRLAPNLGWAEVPVPGFVELPLRVENEAKLATLGELHASKVDSFIYVSGEIGIGSGIVLERRLFRGTRGWAGELGHVTVDPRGHRCRCGARGCLEQYAGEEAIRRAGGAGSLSEVVSRAQARDEQMLAALERAGEALGVALASAVNLLDLPNVVLGGHFAPLVPWLRTPVQRELRRRVITARWAPPTVRPSLLGGDAAVVGAARSVTEAIVEDPAGYLTRNTA